MPATRMNKCPMSCTCHAKTSSRLQNVPKVPRLPWKTDIVKKGHVASVKLRPRKKKKLSGDNISRETSVESGKSKSFCAVRATKFAGPADPNPEPKPGLNPYRKNPSVATLCGEKSADPCRWQRGARQRRSQAKGKGTKTGWAMRDVYWENMWHDLLSVIFCKLSFDAAGTVTAAYHDILVRMHHDHSTTLPWHLSIPASTYRS